VGANLAWLFIGKVHLSGLHPGVASEAEAEELQRFVRELYADVLEWLKKNHPEFAP